MNCKVKTYSLSFSAEKEVNPFPTGIKEGQRAMGNRKVKG